MKKIDIANLKYLAFYIICSLFFIGNIKFFKMILSYIGIDNNITIVASGLYAILAAVLVVYFIYTIYTNKQWLLFAIFCTVCFAYSIPYLIYGMLYKIVQYCLFMIPFAIAAYLIATEKNGTKHFFTSMQNISKYAVFLFLIYIIILFVCKPDETGLVTIKEMSYGDIALAALPFLFSELSLYLNDLPKINLLSGVRILVYTAAIIYTGTRSIIICLFVALIIQIALHIKKIIHMPFLKTFLSIAFLTATLFFCLIITPSGSRLNIIKTNMTYEMGDKSTEDIFNNSLDEESTSLDVFCIDTQKYMTIGNAFEYYIVNSDQSISETQKLLHNDIKYGTEKYLIVSDDYRDYAKSFKLPMNNRVYLWSTAWNEFSNSLIIGNGVLHYQIKYENTFPHNVLLEILSDFGLVGIIAFAVLSIFLFINCMVISIRKKDYHMGQILALIVTYVPMHLLFHSLYFNGILFFTITVMIFYIIYNKKYHNKKHLT